MPQGGVATHKINLWGGANSGDTTLSRGCLWRCSATDGGE